MKEHLRSLGWPITWGLLLSLLVIEAFPQWLGIAPGGNVEIQMLPEPERVANTSGPVSYSSAVRRAAPAVASIFTSKEVTPPQPDQQNPTLRDYTDNLPGAARRQSSLGSAVILSSDGYLLTNNHVIADADEILVALQDGRETIARLIGTDPETDLAVLKIDLPNLPAVTISPAEDQRTGDVVMAIGNPFGLGQTVTMGIISATGRNQLGLNTYEDFIQTDAAINQGNSGGALIDAHGNLIGINTAIFSQSGGSQGIGFAIPARLATEVMQAIIANGRVIRGWLGVEVQPLTPEQAAEAGLEFGQGIVISGLYREGPAWQAGLKPGDVILSIDGQPAINGRSAMNQVARAKPGESVSMRVSRKGAIKSFRAEVGVRPSFKP
ncbi:trypsin-like peptidase domain-containing protein [Halopseudomonas nanhaiensis]|uniref:S1C family serine protease n=1 Tax=Halopseudomonas nanhaiensis TaxID=2830842 RepID=UPI001CBFE9AE|nr:trypsin-like peptidase domain-containing protein [Halopseudomonas nanhaiensis]UAW97817.1 trypsin-like peptidase domain-containing protein [Halopseudomonas nanhaiensis]